jgi:divalent metal cation (Fe/Co/Zn/Cd) transporter
MDIEEAETKKMTAREYAKLGVGLVVGSSAFFVVSSIVKDNVNPETLPQKAKAAVGTFIIATIVADAASRHTDRMIDKVADSWNNASKKFKDQQKKIQTEATES